jgi:hypothetical protein
MLWKEIIKAPSDCDLELAVIDSEGTHALVFACRRQGGVWINAKTQRPIDVSPTHWREWESERSANPVTGCGVAAPGVTNRGAF